MTDVKMAPAIELTPRFLWSIIQLQLANAVLIEDCIMTLRHNEHSYEQSQEIEFYSVC